MVYKNNMKMVKKNEQEKHNKKDAGDDLSIHTAIDNNNFNTSFKTSIVDFYRTKTCSSTRSSANAVEIGDSIVYA